MPAFAGFDTSIYPGDAIMSWLKANTNLVWCGYYLAPAPSHSKDSSWMGTRARLSAAGWGIAPLYVGEQPANANVSGSFHLSPGKGAIDGRQTVTLMTGEGFPPGSCVYLDLENGAPLRDQQGPYLVNWCTEVQNGGYTPGIYCSHGLAQAVRALQPDCRIWAFKVPLHTPPIPPVPPPFPEKDPSGSGFPDAIAWQLDQNRVIKVLASQTSLTVDLDSANTNDPGAPLADAEDADTAGVGQ